MSNAVKRRNMTIDEIWGDLEEGLKQVYLKLPMVPARYMQLYTYVYDYCTAVTITQHVSTLAKNRSQRTGRNLPSGSSTDFVGHDLYSKLTDFIMDHVKTILVKCDDLSGEDLLRFFVSEWDKFRFCSKVVDGIFSYLNRHWIKRELENSNTSIFYVYTLALVKWKEILSVRMKESVNKAVLDLIENERNGITVTSQLIKGVVDCFVELGVDEPPDAPIPSGDATRTPSRLRVYKTYFEAKFLEVTEQYYSNEAQCFLENGTVTDYMKRVERRLEEERVRCEMYLNQASLTPLATCCEKVLIYNQLELFQKEFCTLLETQRDEDLGRMYVLCERVDGGLDELRKTLEEHIKKQGLAAVSAAASTISNDAKEFVHTLLKVHMRYQSLVATSFRNESGFVQALDKAATHYINRNAVTVGEAGANNVNSSKCPELLARYCDQILRKSARNTDENEMEEMLNKVMVIFKYIEDKDIFQKFYTKMFAKRLVQDISASDEAESNMIAKLKQMCGFEYTSKMQRMFTDTGLSKEISDKFRESCLASNKRLSCDFNVMVLGANAWPSQQPMPMLLPQRLNTCMSEFTAFYNTVHTGRKLTWVYSQSRGELVTNVWPKRYSFVALTPQMSVLLLFNESLEYAASDILAALEMKKEQLSPILASLVKADILRAVEGGEGSSSSSSAAANEDGGAGTRFALNLNYQNKKLKVDLSKNVMRTEAKQEQSEVQQNVEENRKMVIQAAIVRIMKTRKRMSHSQLMTEVIAQLTSRFKPKIPMVKKCIDILIEKEYLSRLENERDTYEYLA